MVATFIGIGIAILMLIGYGFREYIFTIFAGQEPDDTPFPVEKKKG